MTQPQTDVNSAAAPRNVKRVASVIGIEADKVAQYELLHANVWPAVLAQIKKSSIRNYSIYRHESLLFSYFEYVGDDYEADMAAMGQDPSTQEWWDVCMPLQSPLPDRPDGSWWSDIPEVFHTD